MQADEFVAASIDEYINKLIALGNDTDYRRYCSTTLRDRGQALYEDNIFITALDDFLRHDPC